MNNFIKIICAALCVVSCKVQPSSAISKHDIPVPIYRRIQVDRNWGYVNQKNDTIIPLGKYNFLYIMDEQGMILTESKDEKWGYINIQQDTLIPFIYEQPGVFSYGLAPASLHGKYGFIDRNGKVVIPFRYENRGDFNKYGMAQVKLNGKYGYIDQEGKQIIPIQYDDAKDHGIDSLLVLKQKKKWAFFSQSGEQITDFKFDNVYRSRYNRSGTKTFFKKGPCLVEIDGAYAYLNEQLEEVIPFGTFSTAEPFHNYLAIVTKNRKYGIIDTLGNVVYPLQYDFIEHPKEYSNSSDLFIVQKDEHFQLLDRVATPLTSFEYSIYNRNPYQYHDYYYYHRGQYRTKEGFPWYMILKDRSGMVGTVSDDGTVEIPFHYQKIVSFDGDSITIAKRHDKFGFINASGEPIRPFIYDSIVPVHYGGPERFIVRKNQHFGIIDINDNIIIPIEFDAISNWIEYGPKEHFITKNEKKGLISREGEIVIPPIYDEIWVNNATLIKVKNNGRYGTIDWENKIIHEIKYDKVLWKQPLFSQKPLDTIYLKQNGSYISTDTKGNVLKRNLDVTQIEKKFGYELRYE